MIDKDVAAGGITTKIFTEEERAKAQINIKSTGGLSNTVVIVNAVDDKAAACVYRFVTSEAGNHEIERKLVYILADLGIIPRVLGQTEIYRVDHFITGCVMNRTDCLTYGPDIAKALAQVHSMGEICESFYESNMIDTFFSEDGWITNYQQKVKPEYCENYRRQSTEAARILDFCDAFLSDMDAMKREIKENVLTEAMYQRQVFSHGDVHANNIMTEGDELYLIDFEYAGVTFRGWDFSLLITENSIAYEENGASFVYHPESNWDLNGEKESATLLAYLGEHAT